MSLLTLLLGILTTLAPMLGVRLPDAEPAAAALPARELVLEPCCEHELSARDEELMLAAVQYRCELVGLRGIQLRREGRQFILRVNSGLIPRIEEYTDTLDELETILNERTTMRLLPVHPGSDILVRDGSLLELLAEYETAVIAYEENAAPGESAPPLPALPPHLGVPDCILAEHSVVSREDGSSHFEYLIIQSPAHVSAQNLLITEQDVERAAIDAGRGCIEVLLTQRGGDTLSRLTGGMQHGTDRLAILLNDRLVCAPVVHTVLGCSFCITGLSPDEQQMVVDGLARPLPVPVRVITRRAAE